MPLGSTLEGDLLNLMLCGKPISSMATSAGSTLTWQSLHTADPSSGTGQNQSELAVTGYARVSVDRSTSGFAVSGSGPASASPVANINFAQCTSTSTGTVTHWSIGMSSAGAGKIIASGVVTPNINISQNVTPQLTTASSVTLS
jgi:hypothetical protein